MNRAAKQRVKRNAARRRNRQRQGRARSRWMRACVRRWRDGKVTWASAWMNARIAEAYVNEFAGLPPPEVREAEPPAPARDDISAALRHAVLGDDT